MTSERRRQIEELYHAALDLAAAERAALLDRADSELRREVESLLAQEGSVLSRPAWQGGDPAAPQGFVGIQVGPYRVESKLGEGGMGEVFRAFDTKLNRPVAIKFLPPELADAPARRRFQREARMASSLNHPHILTVYDAGEIDGKQYLVTEYVDGGTLRDWLAQEKRTWQQVVELLTGAADGLAAAHAANILHRDIKPANILITKGGYAKLADFGLAKLEAFSGQEETATLTEGIAGTAAYMSPEQASGGKLDARSDVFSFGIVLYEALAGRRPFSGKTTLDLLQNIVHGTPPPLGEDIPSPLKVIVERALAKGPFERYQSMHEMVGELRRLVRQPVQHAPRAHRPWIWIAAAALLLAAVAAAWSLWPRPAPTQQVRSIAVLPLKNLSGDPSQAYIAEGATEELIANLGQIHAFEKVISRTTMARYAGSPKSMSEIARELGVDAIVEGSIQRGSGRTRVLVQLISATDAQLWSQAYDHEGADLLSIEADVARAIAQEIRARITPQEREHLARAGNIDPAAQEAYLLGTYHVLLVTEPDLRQAIEYFEKAIRLQPDYAPAYAGLSQAWQEIGIFGLEGFHNTDKPARQAVRKALDLDPNLAAAHCQLGDLFMTFDWNWSGAEREMRRAVELDPNNLRARETLGDLLTALGRFPEALEQKRRAVAVDPLSAMAQSSYGRTLYRARRYEEAIPRLQRAIELEPQVTLHAARLADVYEQMGRIEDALPIRQKNAQTSNSYSLASLSQVYARLGRRQDAQAALAKAIRAGPPNMLAVALAYFALGDKDRCFEWLNKGVDDRQFVIFWKIDPQLDSVRSDPRFQALIARLKMPETP